MELQTVDQYMVGAEVKQIAQACIVNAMKQKKYKTVSNIMRDMVELLQSLGIVYRAPKTSQQLSLIARANLKTTGYQKYMNAVGEDSDSVCNVLDDLMTCIATGELKQ
jgi:hypothetical protein